MPLRDHFEPNARRRTWEPVSAMLPMMIVQRLFDQLPEHCRMAPRLFRGGDDTASEPIIVGTGVTPRPEPPALPSWASSPTFACRADLTAPDAYEVRLYDCEYEGRLAAVILIVRPSNKDCPDRRQAFVAKCAAWLQRGVCVSILDLVTNNPFNLCGQLLDLLGVAASTNQLGSSPAYAATLHHRYGTASGQLDVWANVIRVGQPLPKIPVWLNDHDGAMLDLEATYEETCRNLRIP